jgi:hypothetical protein
MSELPSCCEAHRGSTASTTVYRGSDGSAVHHSHGLVDTHLSSPQKIELFVSWAASRVPTSLEPSTVSLRSRTEAWWKWQSHPSSAECPAADNDSSWTVTWEAKDRGQEREVRGPGKSLSPSSFFFFLGKAA